MRSKRGYLLKKKNKVLVLIPLYWKRLNWRGFNRAEELGKRIGKRLGITVVTDLLIRKKGTISQTELKKEGRLSNVKDAFAVNPSYKKSLTRKTVVILDDVYTTGATLKEVCKTLKEDGHKKVWGLTIAKD